VSVHITSDVWKHSQADGVALLVLLSLADQANDEGECWPKIDQIAERCRVSRRSVFRHLDELRTLGELDWEDRRAQSLASKYRVTVTPRANLAPPHVPDWHLPRANGDTSHVPTVALQETSLEPSLNNTSEPRPDVDAICDHLVAKIEKNTGTKKIITERWRTDARLLLDRDKRPPDEVHQLIDWCQDSTFWRANILSVSKFREKYDTLKLQSQRREPAHSNGFAQHGWLG
jgi:AcrR family transcriptional regulator